MDQELQPSPFNAVFIIDVCCINLVRAVADPGFSLGVPTPKVGVLTYYFAFLCKKLHEDERIWSSGRGDPPNAVHHICILM